MKAFGATIEGVESDNGNITEDLIKGMIARAAEIAAEPGHWWCDQLNNHDAFAGYLPLREEIWAQTNGQVDAFVHVFGTTIRPLQL